MPYASLIVAFSKALQKEMDRLDPGLHSQVTDWKRGASVKFHPQGGRHELSLHQWIGEKGRLQRFSVVVRQNGPDGKPYGFREKAPKSKWDSWRWRGPGNSLPNSFAWEP